MYKIYGVNGDTLIPVVMCDRHLEAADSLSDVCPKTLASVDCFQALQICRSARNQGVQVTRLHLSETGKVYCVGFELDEGEGRVAA